jgi:hypothetical protein
MLSSFSLRWLRCFVYGFVLFVPFVQAPAFAQMPDPKQMSGTPLPVGDLSPGTVTARVIRGQLSNPIAGQTVEVTGAGAAKTASTDSSGRATFTGLTPGTRVKVRTTVGGETIESQEFDVPAVGGIRLMLVATDTSAAAPGRAPGPAPQESAVEGAVALGPETRFVIEVGDDVLNVFNMLQITNPGTRPVRVAGPLMFDLPKDAVGAGMMEGSTPSAVVAGGRVTVNGPFPPGNTVVQFGYSLPLGTDTMTIVQTLPLPLPQLSLVAQKTAGMQLSSPNVGQRREMSADGNTYIVAQGGAIPAGGTLALTLSGLPARPLWPRNLAVGLAAVILAAGVYAASRRPASSQPPSQKRLQTRREQLFADLTTLEAERRKGAVDADTYAARRESLVTALEDLYRGLDSNVREVA